MHHTMHPSRDETLYYIGVMNKLLSFTHINVPFSLCSLINKIEDLSDSAPVTEIKTAYLNVDLND